MTTGCCQTCEMGPGAYACDECGTACCRSCTIQIDASLYCGPCAASVTAPARSR